MKTILCYGDSNIYGLMPDSPDRYPRDVRWDIITVSWQKNTRLNIWSREMPLRQMNWMVSITPQRDMLPWQN